MILPIKLTNKLALNMRNEHWKHFLFANKLGGFCIVDLITGGNKVIK